jgi:hypothetical protein
MIVSKLNRSIRNRIAGTSKSTPQSDGLLDFFFTGPHVDEATQEEGPHAAASQCAPEAAGAAATA